MLKNKFLLILFTGVISLTFFNCGSASSDVEVDPIERTLTDVKEDFQKINFNVGINDVQVEGVNGFVWKFRVIIPASASSSNKRPLIVSLHGGTTLANSEFYKATSCLAEPGFEDLDAIILSPDSDGYPWFYDFNVEKVVELTEMVKLNLEVNLNKVAISGYSDGGIGAWYFAQHFPNKYKAAIPMAAQYDPRTASLPTNRIDIPVYAIHGENDQLFLLNITQGFVTIAKSAGTDVQLIIALGLDHYNSCDYVPYLKDAASWLDGVW